MTRTGPDRPHEIVRAATVNPSASTAARSLLDLLYQVSGKFTLSGQHNTPREISAYSEQAFEITGRRPAVWGQDFGFAAPGDMDGIDYRDAVVAEAIRQHGQGSVITFMWHAVPPTEDEPVTFDGHICVGPLEDSSWQELLTPGTPVHQRWQGQVDVVAELLGRLRDADVPVLWRPYHEMNGTWFWWGGRPGPDGSAALYRMLYQRLTEVHRLDNLLWVWNPNAPRGDAGPYAEFYPGHDVVDVLASDVYGNDYRQSHHDDLAALAEGRPIALGEVGAMPTPEILDSQPAWTWFMTWTGRLTSDNTAEEVVRLYDNARVRHRGT
ncbi:glycosyl hydrolase [Pseudactinotalea terrae]|uniref:glycosyl hydrolase n=1 Tax=Pseudactinotalea terrae TaxID=1743262 RepID=UPI0012E1E312|nr:glycosyl hydrolase [Pseudactinotalea terrae]